MAVIERCSGTNTGAGCMAGSGIYGKTIELDELVQRAARRLLGMFDVDITIRFHSDGESGGAYIKDAEWSDKVGISASLVNSVLYKMNWMEKSRLSDEEWMKYGYKDFLKISTCLHRDFLKEGSEYICCDTEFRDFAALDEAAEWILTATNRKMWEYVERIKLGKPKNLETLE